MISLPPFKDVTLTKEGRFVPTWVLWIQEVYRVLSGQRPVQLQSVTVLTLPVAADNTGALIYVSNAMGGAIPAYSDGVNWRRTDTGAIIT